MIANASKHQPFGRPGLSEILAQERSKIVMMLNDLEDLKFFSTGAQRKRLEDLQQTLRLALLENQLEPRHGKAPVLEEWR